MPTQTSNNQQSRTRSLKPTFPDLEIQKQPQCLNAHPETLLHLRKPSKRQNDATEQIDRIQRVHQSSGWAVNGKSSTSLLFFLDLAVLAGPEEEVERNGTEQGFDAHEQRLQADGDVVVGDF